MLRFTLVALFALVPTVASADEQERQAIEALLAQLVQDASEMKKQVEMSRLLRIKQRGLPEGLKGSVTDYKDGLVVINIGIDAGLSKGAKLDIYRDDDKDPQYLGTIVIERVYPKEAVAAFKPASGKALKDLKPEELPKKTDTVGTFKGKKQE